MTSDLVERSGIKVVLDGVGCRPANMVEIELFDRITALEAEVARAEARGYARAIADAAGVAQEWRSSLRPGSPDRLNGHNEAARNIAVAIRALDPQAGEGG